MSQTISLGQYFIRLYQPLKVPLAVIAVCACVLGFGGFINAYLVKVMIDTLVSYQPHHLSAGIIWPAILICLQIEVGNTCWRLIDHVNTRLTPSQFLHVLRHTFNYCQEHASDYFQRMPNGALVSHIHTLAEQSDQITQIVFVRIIRGVVQEVVALISMYLIHPLFAVGLLTWSIFFIMFSRVISGRLLKLSVDYAHVQAKTYGFVADSLANFLAVKLFSSQRQEAVLLNHHLDGVTSAYQTKNRFILKVHYIQGLSITLLMGFILYELIQLRIQQRITIGDFSFVLGMTLYVTEYVWTLTQYLDRLNDLLGKCQKSISVLYQPQQITVPENATDLIVTSGQIVFDRVKFHYHDLPTICLDEPLIIEAKQTVGLVGFSGSGKSTLVKLLLRLVEMDAGDILIDNQSIQQVTLASLHQVVAVIPQEPVLFHRTIYDNIAYGDPSATQQDVVEAARIANIHDDICQFPQAYQTLVGERGVNLSGGQKQRIAIARAILKDVPIWVFDEATSQLDSITELTIQRLLAERLVDKTVIIIAHRLTTVQYADRIIVLNNGNIEEEGSHAELLQARRDYYRFWQTQVAQHHG